MLKVMDRNARVMARCVRACIQQRARTCVCTSTFAYIGCSKSIFKMSFAYKGRVHTYIHINV